MEGQVDFYIPKNVSIRFELIKGIGIRELIYTGISSIIGVIVGIILNGITNNFFTSAGIVAILGGGTFVLNIKDNNNQSVISMIKAITRFYSLQKFYKYDVKECIEIQSIMDKESFYNN
ncbi:MAG: hypothetical protein J6A89_01735 [Clostridia bacterium]|nr:hypothetical protein [Clostridia bacterium]